MRGYHGKAFRLSSPVRGRVDLVKRDEMGFTHLVRSVSDHFFLLRTGRPVEGNFIHPSLLLEKPVRFQIGDILRLTPAGDVYLEYRKDSNDNALFLTPRCNSICRMCPQPAPPESTHISSYRSDLSEQLALMEPSPTCLGITGGEPTCVWDDLMAVLEILRSRHPDCVVQLLTNGRILQDGEKAKILCELLHPSSVVAVPLYSDDARVHDNLVGVSGAFRETMRGLRNLAWYGALTEIRQVPMRPNADDMPRWAEFLYRNVPFVSHVAIMGYEPIGRGIAAFDELWLEPMLYAEALYAAVQHLHRRDIPVSLYNYPLCHISQSIWRFALSSISDWKVRFRKECGQCAVRDRCGGLFFSARDNPRIPCRPIA